jgi:hypothetical protein
MKNKTRKRRGRKEEEMNCVPGLPYESPTISRLQCFNVEAVPDWLDDAVILSPETGASDVAVDNDSGEVDDAVPEGLRFRHRGFSSFPVQSLKGSPVLEFRLGIFRRLGEE